MADKKEKLTVRELRARLKMARRFLRDVEVVQLYLMEHARLVLPPEPNVLTTNDWFQAEWSQAHRVTVKARPYIDYSINISIGAPFGASFHPNDVDTNHIVHWEAVVDPDGEFTEFREAVRLKKDTSAFKVAISKGIAQISGRKLKLPAFFREVAKESFA